ncbi:MAG: biotin-dependent carboxyltransferase family protein [Saprospiraceae bacterium]|nr:biotin-dependent carboxyltransferase family protein [Saprospiraceae bacterium]
MLTTIQDLGRFYGAHLGIPISGPMDRKSAMLANLTLNNEENDAVLECTFIGPTLQFDERTVIAIKGAQVSVLINNELVSSSSIIYMQENDVLSFGKIEKGCRFYIAVKGGFQTEEIYGSRSTCYTAGILKPLKKEDTISYFPYHNTIDTQLSISRKFGNTHLHVSKGPEFTILSPIQQKLLMEHNFTILSQSNRMAYRVTHALNLRHNHSILSSGTLPGTVQLTQGGDIICLMRDTQTTGGYPRILQLSEKSQDDLAQLKAGERFTFTLSI